MQESVKTAFRSLYMQMEHKSSMELKRILEDVEIEEVSLVDVPANLRKFFFIKRNSGTEKFEIEKGDTSISIDSDGTIEGTKITINGKKLKNISNFLFSFFLDSEFSDGSGPVFSQFTLTSDKKKDGFTSAETFTLAKAKIDKSDNTTMDFMGIDINIDGEDGKDIAKNLHVLKEYQDAFPQEVKESFRELVDVFVNKDKTETINKGDEEMLEIKKEETNTEVKQEAKTETKQETINTSEVATQVAELLKPVIAESIKEQVAATLKEQEEKAQEPETVTMTVDELKTHTLEAVEAALVG